MTGYTVHPGDSLWLVARRFHMTVDQLRRVNSLTDDSLDVGQVIQVRGDSPEAPVRFRTINGYSVVTGWNDSRSLDSLRANHAKLTDIATVSHRLQVDGSVVGYLQEPNLTTARQQSTRTWLTVQNLDESGNFSRQLVNTFLANSDARRRFAVESVALLQDRGFIGLDVDLEEISPSNRPYFTALVRELKAALSAKGFLLSMALPAKTADDPGDGWSGAYDYAPIGLYADRVVLMTYDEHWFGGPSGPIASLPWVTRVLRYSTGVIPAEKTLLGIAGYAYDWRLSGEPASSLGDREAEQLARTYGSHWDEASSSPFIRYTDEAGAPRIIWYENERSLKLKFDLALAYGLQGVSIWRLGLEDDALWRSLVAIGH